jgi:amidase
MPALDLATLIRRKELSPVELVDLYLRRIDELDPLIHSYITVAADEALDAARDAERRVGDQDLPPFHGVPVSIKDLIDTAGIRTTYATSAWSDRVPTHDAAVAAKLRQAGFVILGKTNTPEFAGGIYTEPLAYGACRNPWNTAFTPGGSSGGAGSAEAAGLCAVALGSDDGGSVRIPSGWCGLFGIKPSRGRVSAAPEPSAMYYTPGPLTHTVRDGAAVLDAISGYVTGDDFWAPPPARSFLSEVGVDPGSLRIACTTAAADGVEVTPPNVAGVELFATTLEGLGHSVTWLDDWPGRGMFPDMRAVGLHVIYGILFAMKVDHGLMPAAEQLEPGQQALVSLGRDVSASELMWAQRLQAETNRQVVALFDEYDVLVTPVVAGGPSRVGQFLEHPEEAISLLDVIQFTAQFSVSGQPAVSVPAVIDPDGVPAGVQLVGRPGDEATLLRVASQLEVAVPWAGRRPAVS